MRLRSGDARTHHDTHQDTHQESIPRARALDPRSLPLYSAYRRFRHLALTDPSSCRPEGLGRLLLRALAAEAGDSLIAGYWLFRRIGSHLELEQAHEAPAAPPASRRLFLDEPWVAEAMRGRVPLLLPDRRPPHLPGLAHGGAFALLPLGLEREVFVMLQLVEPFDLDATRHALLALRAFADSLLERPSEEAWLEQARRVQTSLLPLSPPAFSGFEFEVRSRSAQIVGGDVYD
ncbi:MAG: hypothetical protein ACREI7_11080, partial [Myxococcota bacterium]